MDLKVLIISVISILIVAACDDGNNSELGSLTPELRAFLEEKFMDADTSGDGALNNAEIQAEIQKDFDDQDTNEDGVLTELDHVGPEYLGEPVTNDERLELVFDSNQDGVVTFQEYSSRINETIDSDMDSDRDGELTFDEIVNFYRALKFRSPPCNTITKTLDEDSDSFLSCVLDKTKNISHLEVNGDINSGTYKASVVVTLAGGSYSRTGTTLKIDVSTKAFFISCQAIVNKINDLFPGIQNECRN